MSRNSYRHHPQVIRAKELARAAGLDPNAPIKRDGQWQPAAAFDEHFARTDSHLHASLQGLLGRYHRYRNPEPLVEDLRAFKAAMAAAHPDRGGSSAFIAARERYVAARWRKRVSP